MENRIEINNHLYHSLGDRWYTAYDDPIALLRAESQLTGSWILKRTADYFGENTPCRVLDVGCGGGFISNRLARSGHNVTGIDLSSESLEVAKKYDSTLSVRYIHADASRLPFSDGEFDVVSAMDFLEHVEDPAAVIQELSRVLRPGGIFLFHTFNRNILSWLVVIKFVEWFVKNTPRHMHLLRMFIKPKEALHYCQDAGLEVKEMKGTRPNFFNRNLLKALITRTVPENCSFNFTSSCLLGYVGLARKI